MELLRKYKSLLFYAVFGAATTLVNLLVYYICIKSFSLDSMVSNITAWIFAAAFAYITNRKWVFESKADTQKGLLCEVVSFYSCRLLTGFLDLAFMFFFVDCMRFHPMTMKCISNMIAILANYIAGKWIIFKN